VGGCEKLLKLTVPLLPTTKLVEAPATELLLKTMAPSVAMKFWVTPELLVMPVPLRVRVSPPDKAAVKALAPTLKTIPFTSVLAESVRFV